MNNIQLEQVARTLFDVHIKIYIQTVPGAWYDAKYQLNRHSIELETVYGIAVDGSNTIDFDFKTGKKEDSILKTFITQFINKWECKQFEIKNGEFIKKNKKDIIAKLKNSNRVSKYFFYTTLYGIGYFCLFMSKNTFDKTNKQLVDYLKGKAIEFKNEFSDAGWVYRFVINQDVKIHNSLLDNFEF